MALTLTATKNPAITRRQPATAARRSELARSRRHPTGASARGNENPAAIAINAPNGRDSAPEQAGATVDEFGANGVERRGAAGYDDCGDPGSIDLYHFPRKRIVAQPESVAVVG